VNRLASTQPIAANLVWHSQVMADKAAATLVPGGIRNEQNEF
jgi:hypothetical protein